MAGTQQSKSTLESYFNTDSTITQQEMRDLIASLASVAEMDAALAVINLANTASVFAQIDNGLGEAGTTWTINNASGEFLAGAVVVYSVSGVVYTSEVATNSGALPTSVEVTASPAVTLPDNTVIAQIPAALAGLAMQRVYNVQDPAYGALGNGSTDDSTAIQAALDAADTAGGGRVVIPDGTYHVVTGLMVGSNTELSGLGSVILQPQTTGMTLITVNGTATQNISIRNIKVDGQDISTDTTAGPMIYLDGIQNAQITGCRFDTIPRNCLVLRSCTDSIITSNVFDDVGSAALVSAGVNIGTGIILYDCTRIVVDGNALNNMWQLAIFGSTDTGTSTDLTISNNVVHDTGDNGIRINSTSESVIIGNTVRDSVIDCIRANGNNNSIIGNVCKGDTITPQSGVKADFGTDYVVSGNNVSTCAQGIFWRCASDVSRVNISDNIVDTCTTNIKVGVDAAQSIRSASYQWTASGSGTNEYYLEANGGGDPSVTEPGNVLENTDDLVRSIAGLGSLAAGEWGYGDNDTLGYSTVYVRLSDGADPDSKATDYVQYNWRLKDFVIADNISNNSTNDGIQVFDVHGLTLTGNICQDNGDNGIETQDSYSITCTGNKCNGNTDAGIRMADVGAVTIGNNVCHDNTTSGILLTIDDNTNNHVAINGNICYQNDDHGINTYTVNDLVLAGNICYNNNAGSGLSQDGINTNACVNVLVYGNRCHSDSAVWYQKYGLRMTNCTTVRIFGNDFAGNDTGTTGGAGNSGVTTVDLTESSAYTPSNVSTLRAYAADSTTTAELANVLGTLIADLQTIGIIG